LQNYIGIAIINNKAFGLTLIFVLMSNVYAVQWITQKVLQIHSDELSILRLRSEVFVVEQNCVFLDMDNNDQKAY
jgi:ElaA protein